MISVTLVGSLGKDSESRMTPEGKKIYSLSLATNTGYGPDKKTLWWRISCFGERWDKLMSWLKKGNKIAVSGSISRPPVAYIKEGVAMTSPLDITADQIFLISGDKKEEEKTSSTKPDQQEFNFNNDLPF